MPFVGLAGIGSIGEALVALGIIAGVLLIAYLVSKFGQNIPFIGNWLAVQAYSFLLWAVNQLQSTYQGALWAIESTVGAIVTVISYPFDVILRFVTTVMWALYWLKNVLPSIILSQAYAYTNSAVSTVYAYASAVYERASAYASNLYVQSIQFTQAVLAQVEREIAVALASANAGITAAYNALSALIAQGNSASLAAVSLVYNTLRGDIAAAEQAALSTVTTAVTALESQLVTVEQRIEALALQYAQAAEVDVIRAVDLTSAVALQDVWPGLITDVDNIVQAIPQELIDIRDEIASIPHAIPGSLLDALAGLGALAVPLLRYLKDCGVPMCRDLHGLSDLFNDLSNVAIDAALLALIVQAAHDPHAAAQEMSTVVGPIVRDAESLFKSLVGV